MSDAGSDPGRPNLHLTPEERRVFKQLFQQADTERIGVVTGEQAVKFFQKTNLPPIVLGEIWQIADSENRGLLTQSGFSVALRLIGHVQAGRSPTPELSVKPAPLPRFTGTAPTRSLSGSSSGGPPANLLQTQATGSIRIPPLTPDRIAQFTALFEKSGAQSGHLPGEVAKTVFERAGLPNEILGRIWSLADRQKSGGLDVTEFIVAMHLITSYKNKTMTALPSVLPLGLYEAAARRPSVTRAPSFPANVSPTHGTGISRQFSGAAPPRTSSPLARPPHATLPIAQQTAVSDWLVTPQDKAKYDAYFDGLDTQKLGYIMGDQAVLFFGNSRLPEEILASIWDLADIKSEGKLDRDLFAVAMYLVRQQRRGGPPLPAFLPAALIPPSMRDQPQSNQSTAPVFDNASNVPTMAKSASDDLFGLDALSTEPVEAPAPINTVAQNASKPPFDADPFAGPSLPSSPSSPQQSTTFNPPAPMSNTFKPFQPSSAFGATLTGQNTGGSNASTTQGQFRSQQQPPQPPPSRQSLPQSSSLGDLLGGDDDEQSRTLPEHTTELANMSSQIGNLRTQMQDVQTKRATHERDLQAASGQKQELQQRLAQFRAQYDQELATVKSLEHQLAQSRDSTRKLQQDLAMIEGTQQDLQTKHQQILQQLEADQRENSSLKERIGTLNAEIGRLRPAIDKMKSDARQTKGMVAINKKQLATNEAERDTLQSKIDNLSRKAEEGRSQSVPSEAEASAQAANPAPSTSTNPFFRRSSQPRAGSLSTGASSAPPDSNSSVFDALFGPSFNDAKTHPDRDTPPVPTLQHPTVSAASTSSDGRLTPSATPPLSTTAQESPGNDPAALPPPPGPEARQFTPGMLPMRPPPSRGQSVASSTRVMPPGSRVDLSEPNPSFSDSPQSQRGLSVASFVTPSNNSQRPSFVSQPSALGIVEDTIPGAFPADLNSPVKQKFDKKPPKGDPPEIADIGQRTSSHGADRTPESKQPSEQTVDGPLSATDRADDSSSDDDAGFDDNFSNQVKQAFSNSQTPKGNTTQDSEASASNSAQPPLSELPSITAQSSPPAYTVNEAQADGPENNRRSSKIAFPPEFEGLLPSREVPPMSASPPPISVSSQPSQTPPISSKLPADPYQTSVSTVGDMQAYHDASSRPSSADGRAKTLGNAAPGTKSAFDDEFADFDNLDEAKVDNEKSFDFADNQSEAEFNPTFDSPAASMSISGAGPSSSRQQTPLSKVTGPGGELGGFHFFSGQSSAVTVPETGRSPLQSAGSNHDWDAIFSGLDQPGPNVAAGDRKDDPSQIPTPRASPPGSSRPQQNAIPEGADDPFLKKLMSMGYPRDKALVALERFDYDINKAADHLSSPA